MEDTIMKNKKDHHLMPRNGMWYFQMKNVKFSLHTTSITEARRLRDKYYKEMLAYGHLNREDKKEVPLFGALAQEWSELKKGTFKKSTVRDYRNSIFSNWFSY